MPRSSLDPPYGAIALDCDSTLSTIEGIEDLTRDHPEVAALTAAAMEGRVPLEQVYGRRLALVQPTRARVEAIGPRYVATLVPGARELVAALHALDKAVVIVSGGLLGPVRHVAAELGIAASNVHAVAVRFDDSGAYAGYEDDSPLARRGGKPELLRWLFPSGDVALVGDGATDLEAQAACARFVAFMGVVHRPAVASGADRVVEERDLTGCLPHLLSVDELRRLRDVDSGRFRGLAERWLS